ncbi:MAG: phosphoglucosamine mutase [Acidobacteria bacterium]|nr:phosphoglucosamine mutase [Acidobacteriota bacterium]
MGTLFGTDGIRGKAGRYPLDHETLFKLGLILGEGGKRILICWDTRESSSGIYRALAGGIVHALGAPVPGGVLPTPAVATLAHRHGFDSAISISASHNPYEDNGIKIFGPGGWKLQDAVEESIEARLAAAPASGANVGDGSLDALEPALGFVADYVASLRERVAIARPVRIVVDCANGASTEPARWLFESLGAELINDSPNGRNINEGCGSLHPAQLQEKVLSAGAEIGIALDGDGDRAIFVDETGTIRDGDYTLLILARALHEEGRLAADTVVATVMANMGLEVALNGMGIRLLKAPVGDRYVLAEMNRSGAILGGEQSGHTIMLDLAPTGDGLLTSIAVLNVLSSGTQPLSALCAAMKKYPQVLLNVQVRERRDFDGMPAVRAMARRVEHQLGGRGRLLLRYSGTEMLARIMIEGEDHEAIEGMAAELAGVIRAEVGVIAS